MAHLKVAILISGRGSNMAALIEAVQMADFPAEVVLVMSNRSHAVGLEVARAANIPTQVIRHGDFDSREAFDAAMTEVLAAAGVRLICLAGFMRLLSTEFCQRWHDSVINIHPSLLPAFKGMHVHERMLEAGVRIAGCTVHYVRPAMDEGPILVQAAVPIAADDTADSLSARILEQEHRIYPLAVRLIAEGRARAAGGSVTLKNFELPEQRLINPPPR
ncbi:MAG: phosphoribosylglycinamide formyltransferase [Alphaproteobacteria bacterium]|jgi:phosphoribosylglycinamide formyltransferase-1|nr:phosphoribosylglycinamide formyltransferase [Rhodospirillaceae bacterium]MDP6020562.1 phosphoribosylglycinamide formyltransferase [Alphaproteobacteria bacterium]MDP6255197.1 phosphoribosylglycinamide formyltransferase [Alphaproteobacteria bacterium]MDP7052617.1 phosphoribosylglycinamide formyltransferase [Alphaproteobacteria bacterium]MDP7229734.1 phosphoribosylglycinamide formyltransferase [Alphaproteobacteria bacterium]|tara:strand:+ start:197 stop:850 length:654 start_codon:yes stop_codon:yes gene_type:complete